MENIFLLMLITITILAVADIVVGVSNDAINFLEFCNRVKKPSQCEQS